MSDGAPCSSLIHSCDQLCCADWQSVVHGTNVYQQLYIQTYGVATTPCGHQQCYCQLGSWNTYHRYKQGRRQSQRSSADPVILTKSVARILNNLAMDASMDV